MDQSHRRYPENRPEPRHHRCLPTVSFPLTRRQGLIAALGSFLMPKILFGQNEPAKDTGDLAIDSATALVFSPQAPLAPAAGLRDARAVWCRIPRKADRSVLLYFHGYNNYVTVDGHGKSRVPDWAQNDPAARAGASGKEAAPLVYGLDKLEATASPRRPIVLVPEVSTLATGSFWAKEPFGQYSDSARLGRLVQDCLKRLVELRNPEGASYLPQSFAEQSPPSGLPSKPNRPPLDRLYLSGHSGAGIPLQEAAVSDLILPAQGVSTDLWLFDCTYWSKIEGFIRFCERWQVAGRLGGGRSDSSRFVCIYCPGTDTEEVADQLRGEIAKILRVPAASLVKDHTRENFESEVRPSLHTAGAIFIKTHLEHNEIPTFFIPWLLRTSAP